MDLPFADAITIDEAALLMGLHERTLRRLLDKGEMRPAVKVRGHRGMEWRLSRAAVLEEKGRREAIEVPQPKPRAEERAEESSLDLVAYQQDTLRQVSDALLSVAEIMPGELASARRQIADLSQENGRLQAELAQARRPTQAGLSGLLRRLLA